LGRAARIDKLGGAKELIRRDLWKLEGDVTEQAGKAVQQHQRWDDKQLGQKLCLERLITRGNTRSTEKLAKEGKEKTLAGGKS